MTDDEAAELLHPPRQWPPLSAAVAAALLVATAHQLLSRRWLDAAIPLVALLIVARPAWNLVRGNTAGVGGGLGVVALVFLLVAPVVVVRLMNGIGWTDVLSLLPVVPWMLTTGFLLWWPATRRWCRLLPPASDEDEAG